MKPHHMILHHDFEGYANVMYVYVHIADFSTNKYDCRISIYNQWHYVNISEKCFKLLWIFPEDRS